MEFFRIIDAPISARRLQDVLSLPQLPRYCDQIDKLLSHEGDEGEIYCLWGAFRIRRECINGGVRFTLPGCPNALAWTMTTDLPPQPERIVVHCTINRQGHDPDFIESIEVFVDAWAEGLLRSFG